MSSRDRLRGAQEVLSWTFTVGVQLTVDDPAGLPPSQRQCKICWGSITKDKAAGFWTDNNGRTHGFVVLITPKTHALTFLEIGPNNFSGAVATPVSGITNTHTVCGFWTDTSTNDHGFYGPLGGIPTSFEVPFKGMPAKSSEVFGCNDKRQIVGSFTDAVGNVHGFYSQGLIFVSFDAPGSKQITAFGVKGTTINGVDNGGAIVGFFSDGTNVKGFVGFAERNGKE